MTPATPLQTYRAVGASSDMIQFDASIWTHGMIVEIAVNAACEIARGSQN